MYGFISYGDLILGSPIEEVSRFSASCWWVHIHSIFYFNSYTSRRALPCPGSKCYHPCYRTNFQTELTFKPSSQRSGNSGSSSVHLDHVFKATRLARSRPTIWTSLGMWTIHLFPPCPKYWPGYGYSGAPCIVQMSFHSSATVTYEWIAPIHVLCSESAFTQTL